MKFKIGDKVLGIFGATSGDKGIIQYIEEESIGVSWEKFNFGHQFRRHESPIYGNNSGYWVDSKDIVLLIKIQDLINESKRS